MIPYGVITLSSPIHKLSDGNAEERPWNPQLLLRVTQETSLMVQVVVITLGGLLELEGKSLVLTMLRTLDTELSGSELALTWNTPTSGRLALIVPQVASCQGRGAASSPTLR